LGLWDVVVKKGINGERRRKEESCIKCDNYSMWATSMSRKAEGTNC